MGRGLARPRWQRRHRGRGEPPGLTLGAADADTVDEGQVDVGHLAHQAGGLEKGLRGEEGGQGGRRRGGSRGEPTPEWPWGG